MKQPNPKRAVPRKTSSRNSAAATTRVILGEARTGSMLGRVNPKWASHYRALQELRERLLKEQGDQLRQAAEPLERHSFSLADSATDEFDHDLALSQLAAEQNALFEIDEALKRILNGTYGVCEETGKPIAKERLQAIPWTRFVKEVAARLENEGAVKGSHLGTLGSVRGEASGNLEESDAKEKPSSLAEAESLRRFSLLAKLPGYSREPRPGKRRMIVSAPWSKGSRSRRADGKG
jgi:RNA polymerase-binding transcription factor DksA